MLLACVALFFDSHERFWGDHRDTVGQLYHEKDEWFRSLLSNLDLTAGIVAIVAGHEPPKWHELLICPEEEEQPWGPPWPISADRVNAQLVGNFSNSYALEYLRKALPASAEDQPMLECLCDVARVSPDEVQPWLLGLCVDVVLAARRHGQTLLPADFANRPAVINRVDWLVNRLLLCVGVEERQAIPALSVCRAFDWEIYTELGRQIGFTTSSRTF